MQGTLAAQPEAATTTQVCTRGTEELKSDKVSNNSNKCIRQFKDLAVILLLEVPPC